MADHSPSAWRSCLEHTGSDMPPENGDSHPHPHALRLRKVSGPGTDLLSIKSFRLMNLPQNFAVFLLTRLHSRLLYLLQPAKEAEYPMQELFYGQRVRVAHPSFKVKSWVGQYVDTVPDTDTAVVGYLKSRGFALVPLVCLHPLGEFDEHLGYGADVMAKAKHAPHQKKPRRRSSFTMNDRRFLKKCGISIE